MLGKSLDGRKSMVQKVDRLNLLDESLPRAGKDRMIEVLNHLNNKD